MIDLFLHFLYLFFHSHPERSEGRYTIDDWVFDAYFTDTNIL